MGVPQFKSEKYEADDLIGTIAKRFSSKHKIFIVTKDRDALQLIDMNTTVWLHTKQSNKLFMQIQDLDNKYKHAPSGYFPFSLESFRMIYGLEPEQLIDLKGLVGDTSDGIPGIDKMGEKTAIPLLQCFETIENFYETIESLDLKEAKKLLKEKQIKRVNLEKMIENKKIALLSKTLATINTDVPSLQSLSLKDLRFTLDTENMKSIFRDLEFHSLLN